MKNRFPAVTIAIIAILLAVSLCSLSVFIDANTVVETADAILTRDNNPVYEIVTLEKIPSGYHGIMKRISGQGPYGKDVDLLELLVEFQTEDRLHVKITDASRKRWEVPPSMVIHDKTRALRAMENANYDVQIDRNPFALVITRKSDKHVIFDTRNVTFIYEDQFLTMGTNLQSNDPHIYGLGERAHNFRLDPNNRIYTIWPRDWGTPISKNLYGSHPFYVEYDRKNGVGTAHGVFLLNSNAMDIKIDGPNKKLHFMTIGGVMDFYFFSGPRPMDVVRQYQRLIGFPVMHPFWALGFHQCRWGYSNVEETRAVVNNFRKHALPLDTIWNDIDYMDKYKDFTTDPVNFPVPEVQKFVRELHSMKMTYMAIIDPAILIEEGYEPYDEGMRRNIFIRTGDGKDVIKNTVWPGLCVFPDFSNPETHSYWHKYISQFMKEIPISGIWIDMNEPAGFCDGSCEWVDDNELNFPPYVPGGERLIDHTLSLDARCNISIQYNTHSLYGHMESISTYKVLENIHPTKRPFVITRSTFSSTGRYAGHWLGDNQSTWSDLFYSISGVLSMNMFGIPFVGADICGFSGDVETELCLRWMQLGSLYFFSRNHNNKQSRSQEPYAFDQRMTDISRDALEVRYSLVNYFYTLLYETSIKGGMTWIPMLYAFPDDDDPNMPFMDRQFMIGDALIVTPVLDAGVSQITVYFPDQRWFDFYTGSLSFFFRKVWATIDAPLEKLPMFIRGGSIFMKQKPALTTPEVRQNPFELVLALNDTGSATGNVYQDDGVSANPLSTFITFNAIKRNAAGILVSVISQNDYIITAKLDKISILGAEKEICAVNHDGQPLQRDKWHYDTTTKSLRISKLGQSLNKNINIQWADC